MNRMAPLFVVLVAVASLGLAGPGKAWAQPFAWPGGAKAAIVLTYDDSLRSQLDVAVPQLDAAGLKGTFFLNGTFAPEDVDRWRAVAAAGHELGNHSLLHPCPAAAFEMEPQYHTERYSVTGMLREIRAMNGFLRAIDGHEGRSYGVPCSQTIVGGVDYTEALRASGLVRFVRGGSMEDGIISDPTALDLFRVPSRGFEAEHDAEDLVGFATRVRETGGMGVFTFHGVGGDYLNVSGEAHEALLRHLTERGSDYWVAPFSEVMSYVAARQAP